MDDADLQLLSHHPDWEAVLRAYLDRLEQFSRSEQSAGGMRWLDRIAELHGLDQRELAAIHGKLIAHGWLRFQFEESQTGLTYRVSPEGCQMLSALETRRSQAVECPEDSTRRSA